MMCYQGDDLLKVSQLASLCQLFTGREKGRELRLDLPGVGSLQAPHSKKMAPENFWRNFGVPHSPREYLQYMDLREAIVGRD